MYLTTLFDHFVVKCCKSGFRFFAPLYRAHTTAQMPVFSVPTVFIGPGKLKILHLEPCETPQDAVYTSRFFSPVVTAKIVTCDEHGNHTWRCWGAQLLVLGAIQLLKVWRSFQPRGKCLANFISKKVKNTTPPQIGRAHV